MNINPTMTTQNMVKNSHRMNSTNESSFTENQQDLSQSWLRNGAGASPDPRSFILMKTRVEEGSKQLKHEVAQ